MSRALLTRANWVGPTVHLSTCQFSDGCKWVWGGRFLYGWQDGHPYGWHRVHNRRLKWVLARIRACKVCRPDLTPVGVVSDGMMLSSIDKDVKDPNEAT